MREPRFDPGTHTQLKVDLDKMKRGGLDAVFFIIYVEQGPRTPQGYAKAVTDADEKVVAIERMVQKYPDRIRLARTPAEVVANRAAGKLSALMGVENGFVIGHDEKSIARLDALQARGVRYLGLTHTGHNDICTSSGTLTELGDKPAPDVGGLSEFGSTVVRRLNQLGVMVDVSHSSDACVRDVLRLSSAPIIASHSSARALADHPRNLSDDLMRAIAAKGGVIQIVAYTGFLKLDAGRDAAEKKLQKEVSAAAGDSDFVSEKHEYTPAYQAGLKQMDKDFPLATLDDYLNHIQHAVEVAGIDHVGIASDFDGGGGIVGWNDATETRKVTAGLKRRGFTDEQIAHIWSGNLLRVWLDVEQAARTAAVARKPPYDAIFDEVMKYYHLPGLALGVIEDGKVAYVRTAGEVIEGSGQPITPDTLFKIASNSKAMTAGVLARLVDAGKLQWDDPVVKWLPNFKMSDPWITREIRVQDLLIHNSGLPEGAGDLMLWPEPNQFTRADIIAGLAHLKPSHSFRSHYDYDNTMYIVAGEVAAAVAGVTYEELVRREVFQQVGLSGCRVGEWRLDQAGSVAQPHMREGDRNKLVGRDDAVVPAITSAAAGGIRCGLNDMLKWARMWLEADVKPPGQSTPWITHAQRDAMWTPHTPMPLSDRQRRWDNGHFNAYGYAFRLSDVDGVQRVAHTGTLSGMYSAMTLLPQQRSGFVFMMNGEGSDARTVLNEALVKQFTAPGNAPSARWYIDELEQERASQAPPPSRAITERRELAAPKSLAQWLGTYRDPWFGEISICERNGNVRFSAVKSPMMSGDVMRLGDRLLVDWEEDAADVEPLLTFTAARKSQPATLTMAKVDPEADFSSDYEDLFFTRTGDCSRVPKPAALSDREAAAQVDALMREYAGTAPGASLLVIRNGTPVIRKSYGLAHVEDRTPATPQTNYRLASVTKQFTAASILLLAQSGRLKLDDPVRKWLPSLPEAAEPMTIRQLLTHTSGLIDYEEVMPDGLTRQLHDADVLAILEKQNRTYFKPGTSYLYSNSGYSLLALIVEKASGQRFAAFLREHVFQPLGMNDTVAFEEGVSTVSHRAFGYTASAGGWTRTDQSLTSAVLGDGGIYSSIDDLAKWDAALYDDRLLSKESRALAFTPATHTDNSSIDYGFGWRISGETLWHSGETMGFRNVIVRYPRRHLTVIVLTNRNDPEPYRLALSIAERFLPGTRIE